MSYFFEEEYVKQIGRGEVDEGRLKSEIFGAAILSLEVSQRNYLLRYWHLAVRLSQMLRNSQATRCS